ncbi:hypothetical protein BDZ97DRAFT_833041 [Flammula alnicola]|nr:hypothetical protein BDZ97DRAFT_833041 [Flammula alnicola]
MVLHAGRGLYMSISMNQGEARALQLDSLKEALPESSNSSNIANAEASFGLQQPHTAGVYEFEAGSQRYCDRESVAPLNARSNLKRITPENLKDHVPKTIHQRIVGYMRASDLFNSTTAILLHRHRHRCTTQRRITLDIGGRMFILEMSECSTMYESWAELPDEESTFMYEFINYEIILHDYNPYPIWPTPHPTSNLDDCS